MKIPTYQNTNGIKVGNTPELNLASVKSSERAQEGLSQAIANVGKNFAEVEEARGKIRDFRQTNEADAYAFEKLNEIKALADEDIDFDPTRYEEEINKVGQEASKTISNQIAKDKFMADFQRQATTTFWGIKNLFRTRELEAAKASIEYKRQQLVNNYPGMSHAEQLVTVANFKKSLMEGVKSGIYNQGTANQIDMNLQKDLQESVVNTHIISNPETTKAELEKGKDGSYPGISEEFRAEAITKADAYDKKYKAEAEAKQKELIDTNENDIVTRMIDPSKSMPTEGEIVTMLNSNNPEEKISPRFAKAAIENIRSAKKTKEDKKRNPAFNKMADFITNAENKPEDLREELLRQNALGLLNQEEFNILYTFSSQTSGKNIDAENPKKSFLQTITIWSDENAGMKTSEAKARMYKDYMMRVNNGEEPALAIDAVLKKEVSILHPQIASYPKEGKKVMDISGVFKRIFPTGEIKDEEVKKENAI